MLEECGGSREESDSRQGLSGVLNFEYRRGFACFPRARTVSSKDRIASWNSLEVGDWVLYVHPESSICTFEPGDAKTVIALGDIFVAHGERTLSAAVHDLSRGDWTVVEELSGKFALLTFDRGELTVLNDPLGSQGVYYASEAPVVGSHAALVAELLSIPRSRGAMDFMALDDQKRRATKFLPGDLTMFDGVRMLIPNNELRVGSGSTRRYWPFAPGAESTPTEASLAWDEYFTKYSEFLTPRYAPVLGVTGGADSRSIIATLRSKGADLHYETWDRVSAEERAKIETMVAYLGGEHRWVTAGSASSSPRFAEVVKASARAGGYARGGANLTASIAEGARPDGLFIYGHGTGVMRGSFNTEIKPWLPEDPLKLAYRLYAGPVGKDASTPFRRFAMRAFKEFLSRGNYSDIGANADLGDLLYWEHRMANWAGPMIAAHSVAMNAHAGFNSRRLFRAFWGIREESRYNKDLNRSITSEYDSIFASL